MRTDDLIDALADGVAPARRSLVPQRLGLGLLVGMAGTFLVLLLTLRLRPDLGVAVTGAAFWIKLSYTLSLVALGLWLVERQSRAGADAAAPGRLLLAPVMLLALVAAWQLSRAPADWLVLTLGQSARVCSLLIAAFSLPIFVAVFWAMRALAPTRLTLAGASAGLLAGAASASLYCLHCPEAAAPFVLAWYSLGILLVTGLGALAGRWALRW